MHVPDLSLVEPAGRLVEGAEGYVRGGVQALDQASIGLAAATFEISGLPPLRMANAIRSSEGGRDHGSGASATND